MTTEDFPTRFGEWALIVGASTGLGAAWAEECAKRGMNVVICARSEDKLADVAAGLRERHGVQTQHFVVDISDMSASQTIIENVAGLDIGLCVWNAAIEQGGHFVNSSEEHHVDQVVGNALNPMRVTYHLTRDMAQKHRGAILLVSSMAGVQGTANQASYSGTKAFLAMLGESLWYEMAQYGVRVASVTVGAVNTPQYQHVQRAHAEAAGATEAPSDAPQPHSPEEVAAYVIEHIDDGPRLFSHPDDEAAFTGMSQLPRKDAVSMISAVTDRFFSAGYDELDKLPKLPKEQWI